ncbi:MFS transporter [Pseudonocardia xishanensis]|uniref:MFS transporter n=1 Tax=Pseudonocardia xishanensis TaxID=630995 RepID=A0ABP8RW68_9PSEU
MASSSAEYAQVVDNRTRRRAAQASIIGTVLEYYDFSLYAAAAATVFGAVFFAGASPAVATLQAVATFAVGFLVRPIAGTILGGLGDRYGRKRILLFTMVLMGVATSLIAVVPTREQIGWLAPVLLIVLRLLQGIGASAEYSGATLVAVEFAKPGQRGLLGSLPGAGSTLGAALGTLMLLLFSTVLSREQFLSWGWRVPFLLSLVLVAYALWLRIQLPETPEYERSEGVSSRTSTPVRDTLRQHPRALICIVVAVTGQIGLSYFYTVFMATYATNQLGFDASQTFIGLLVAQLGSSLTFPFFGWLSDRIGRLPVMFFGFAFSAALAFPAFFLTTDGALLGYCVMVFLGNAIGSGAVFAVLGTFISEHFPPHRRFSSMGLSRETGNAIGAAVVPLLAVALSFESGTSSLSLLLIGLSVLGAAAIALMPKTPAGAYRAPTAVQAEGPAAG